LFYGKGFQDFRVTTIFGRPRDWNRKKPKTQTAYRFCYCKQCYKLNSILRRHYGFIMTASWEKIYPVSPIYLTFSAICQGKLLVGTSHIAIKVFPTILLSKSKILPAFLSKKRFEV